jgi:delta 1-pyrroline-5-carboxylate dehydrogenase
MTPFRNETPARLEAGDASLQDAALAVERARRSAREWSGTSVADRAALLLRTAAILRMRRSGFADAVLLEVHKNWNEADADVCEAIDFLEYYAREALRIAEEGPMRPRGVAAVIAPWNFPLAILTGMTAAALVTGNAVLMKPAEQSPRIARRLFEILAEAGAPPDILQFLPGRGEAAISLSARPGSTSSPLPAPKRWGCESRA